MRRTVFAAAVAAVFLVPLRSTAQPDTSDTRLLQMPAVSRDHIAFVYAEDLWVCDRDGRNVRRLTSAPGLESYPVFSPDGRTIAYSAQDDAAIVSGSAGSNIWTIPVQGGEPTRLTWYPGRDLVRGWSPDGTAVLFSSTREVFSRGQNLFTVPAGGGLAIRLPVPSGNEASYSPDGAYIAYTPYEDFTTQRKNYRGGAYTRIWVLRLKDLTVEEIPQPAGHCNDSNPRWLNGLIYFRSDRNGEYNLFSYDPKTREVRQLTRFDDFPVIHLNAGGGNLIFEQAGYLHGFDVTAGESRRLQIGVAAELPETRPRLARGEGTEYVMTSNISPSGARAVFQLRGEIVTMPAAQGEPRNLTNTPGVHERFPAWSPDGKSIAYFSDAGGEYALHVRPAPNQGETQGEARVYKPGGTGYYEDPVWSPDAKKIAWTDNSWTLYWLDLANGKVKKIASEPLYGEARRLQAAWSPDSQWIAYTLGNLSLYRTIYLYSLAEDASHALTDGMSHATEPVFDASGQYLYFFASTNAGPVNQWFNLSSQDLQATRSLYLALLRKDTPSPFRPESGEEGAPPQNPIATEKSEPVRIDFDGLDRRLLAFPLPAGNYRSLQAGEHGQIFYLSVPEGGANGPELLRYDLARRQGDSLLSGVPIYQATPDGRKAIVLTRSDIISIIDLAPGADPGKSPLNVEAVAVRVEPRAEWRQIFDEAWRINRDYFYDPNMQGVDWPAMKRKYEVFLPHLTSSADLYRVIRWMLSELAVSHSVTSPGERVIEPKTTPGGLLGADYEIADGRYRFKKVYGGAAWWPELRAPLAVPGMDVKAGEYLLAVNGVDLKPSQDVQALLQNTGGKRIEITVGPRPDGSGARTVTVEPLAAWAEERNLRLLDWVEGNRRKVEKATGGRVAYIYLPDTGSRGFSYFKRYFYAQLDKDAVILDERYNSGGAWADAYLDPLRRPFSSYWAMRYGTDFRSPSAAILGPKVMLINELAGSGGDGLPWMFRQSKLGPLVGKRTYGGEVGTLNYPELMDGGAVTAPDFALWSPEEGWVIENVGVPPDVEVDVWPADVYAGRDPQLEKAIEIIQQELKKNPPARPQRPPYPIRVHEPSSKTAQPKDADGVVVDGQLGNQIDQFLSGLSGFGYSGVTLVEKDGKLVLRKGYGLANDEAHVPITPETVFDIGSLAKQFTAAAILKLEMQGKLKVTDTIGRYLPDVPKDKSGITIDQLLTHTSGMDSDFPLANPAGEYYEEVNRADAIRRILEMPLAGEPGKSFAYSNVGYVLLAGIVEIAGERPFQDFLRTYLFQPAGMSSTGFWGDGLPPVRDSLIAHSYDESGETGNPRNWSATTWFDLGGGEVVSTVGDLYKWHIALDDNTILSPEASQKLFTPRLDNYGYGWYIQKTPRGTTLVRHGGDYLGFGSNISWFRDENVLMINLVNRDNQKFGTHHVADRLIPQIIFGANEYHMYEGDEFELPPLSVPVKPSLAQEVAGTYQLSTGGRLMIQARNGGLEISGEGQDAINALANASEAEFQHRARLNERVSTIVSAIVRGDSNAFPAEWLRPGRSVEDFTKSFQAAFKEIFQERGALRSVEIIGTAPGAYPVGVLHTKVRLICEKGSEEFIFRWLDDRINGSSSAPPSFAATPLRGSAKDLVGWSIIWFKGFKISVRSTRGKVEPINIRHRDRSVEARRISS